MPQLRLLALALALPLPLLPACAGDDGETMGATTGASTDDATDSASTTAAGTDTAATTTATTDDTTTTTSTTDPTADPTPGTGESTGVTTDATTTDATSTADATSTTDDPTTGGADQLPPIGSVPELLAWLEAGNYTSWAAESGLHQSTGPHGGQVLTFLNDALFDSFSQGLTAHPQGAVAVKELWGNGQEMIGWAVEVKVDADSKGGDGWYWYEKIGGAEYGGGTGVGLCTGCHSGGVDYVLTPWPLQ